MPSLISKNHLNFRTAEEFISALESVANDNAYLPGSLNRELLTKELNGEARPGRLCGYFFATKDLISNTDMEVTGGSKFLRDYFPPINSSVYSALKEEGAFNVVQANSDEFGLGGSGMGSAYGTVPNPLDKTRIVGGSSSGSVYLIRKGLVDFSITSDTGDSARYPASLVGIIGFKPSYGAISRYGFFPFCSAFDTPSICAASMEVVARVFSVVSFPDPHDLCTLKTERRDYFSSLSTPVDGRLRVAVLDDTFWSQNPLNTPSHREVGERFDRLLRRLEKEKGISVGFVKFEKPELLKLVSLLYSVIAHVESVSNYSNLTGLMFPFRWKDEGNVQILNRDNGNNYEEILRNNRSVFGSEFTFRQLLGKYFADGNNYESIYLQSKRIIGLIKEEVRRIFCNYDLIISPTCFDIPEKIAE